MLLTDRNPHISNFTKLHSALFSISLNHFMMELMFLRCGNLILVLMVLFILSRKYLLTFPISNFAGLISRHLELLIKFGLWSYRMINASHSVKHSVLSFSFASSAIAFASLSISCIISGLAFL